MCIANSIAQVRGWFASSGPVKFVIVTLLCAPLALMAGPRVLEETARLQMPGPPDQLPSGVAMAGDYMVVATRRNFDDPAGTMSETFAYLFQRTSATNVWQHVQTLAQNRTAHADAISYAVAMDDNVAVVKSNVLSVFEHSPTSWVLTAQFPVATAQSQVRMDTGTILSGGPGCAWHAYRRDASNRWVLAGSVFNTPGCNVGRMDISIATVFVGTPLAGSLGGQSQSEIRVYAGLNTSPTFLIQSPFGRDVAFGADLAVEGQELITVSSLRPGLVVFRRNSPGVWDFLSTAAPPDALMDPANFNVPHLEMNETFALGGYSFDPHRGVGAGSVRVFRRNTSGTLTEAARLFASDARRDAQLGTFVAVSGRRVAASSTPSAVYVFDIPADLSQPVAIQDDFQSGSAARWTPIAGSSFSVPTARGSRVYRQASLNAAAGSYITNMDWKDQSIQADVRPTAFSGPDRWFGLAVRRTDAANYYYVTVRSTNVIQLKRIVNGAVVTLASAPLSVQLGRNYRLRVEAVGTWIRAYVNGELAVQAQDSTLTHGQAGLQMFKAGADYDNIVITPNPLLGILNDDFDRGVTARWSPVDGEWNLFPDENAVGSTYRQTFLASGARTVTGVRTGDQTVQASARPLTVAGTDVWFGVMARYVDSRNYYYVTLRNSGTVSLRKLVNGTAIVLGTKALQVTPGSWYNVRLEAIGSSLRTYVNGELYLEARDTTFPTGRFGFVTFKTAADFDELLASQP